MNIGAIREALKASFVQEKLKNVVKSEEDEQREVRATALFDRLLKEFTENLTESNMKYNLGALHYRLKKELSKLFKDDW